MTVSNLAIIAFAAIVIAAFLAGLVQLERTRANQNAREVVELLHLVAKLRDQIGQPAPVDPLDVHYAMPAVVPDHERGREQP